MTKCQRSFQRTTKGRVSSYEGRGISIAPVSTADIHVPVFGILFHVPGYVVAVQRLAIVGTDLRSSKSGTAGTVPQPSALAHLAQPAVIKLERGGRASSQ